MHRVKPNTAVLTIVAGLVLTCSEMRAQMGLGGAGGYAGPSILSRGGNQPGRRGGELIGFTPYISVGGSYSNDLTPLSLDEAGAGRRAALFGVQGQAGVYGSHQWRRAIFGVEYRGDYRHYGGNSFYDGTDQALSADYSMLVNRRVSFRLGTSVGTSTQALSGFLAGTYTSPDVLGIPTAEIFDTRVDYMQTSAMVGYRMSSRTSFNFGGDGFFVRRRAKQLVGVDGYRAVGELAHALSRNQFVAFRYDYMKFNFPRAFGASDMHGWSGGYGRQIGRRWFFRLYGGIYRAEVLGSVRVQLSPEIAAILGRDVGIDAVYRVNWLPQFTGGLSYRWRRSSYSVNYSRGITPGNGVYLTSQQQTISGGYSYSGLKKLALGLNLGYSEYDSLYQNAGKFKSLQGGLGVNYYLMRNVSISGQFDARRYSVALLQNRTVQTGSIGITWSPNRIPVSIW